MKTLMLMTLALMRRRCQRWRRRWRGGEGGSGGGFLRNGCVHWCPSETRLVNNNKKKYKKKNFELRLLFLTRFVDFTLILWVRSVFDDLFGSTTAPTYNLNMKCGNLYLTHAHSISTVSRGKGGKNHFLNILRQMNKTVLYKILNLKLFVCFLIVSSVWSPLLLSVKPRRLRLSE